MFLDLYLPQKKENFNLKSIICFNQKPKIYKTAGRNHWKGKNLIKYINNNIRLKKKTAIKLDLGPFETPVHLKTFI